MSGNFEYTISSHLDHEDWDSIFHMQYDFSICSRLRKKMQAKQNNVPQIPHGSFYKNVQICERSYFCLTHKNGINIPDNIMMNDKRDMIKLLRVTLHGHWPLTSAKGLDGIPGMSPIPVYMLYLRSILCIVFDSSWRYELLCRCLLQFPWTKEVAQIILAWNYFVASLSRMERVLGQQLGKCWSKHSIEFSVSAWLWAVGVLIEQALGSIDWIEIEGWIYLVLLVFVIVEGRVIGEDYDDKGMLKTLVCKWPQGSQTKRWGSPYNNPWSFGTWTHCILCLKWGFKWSQKCNLHLYHVS